MRPRRPLVCFLLVFIPLYGVLIAPWPGWNDAYGGYFRALGGTFFSAREGRRLVRFERATIPGRLDTQIVVGNRELRDANGHSPAIVLGLDTRGVGWIPTAFLAALVLASPVPWARRLRAFLLGMVAIHALILFTVEIYIWNESDTARLALVSFTPIWKSLAESLEDTLVTQVGASIVAPAIIWFLVTFRRQDLTAIPQLFGQSNRLPFKRPE